MPFGGYVQEILFIMSLYYFVLFFSFGSCSLTKSIIHFNNSYRITFQRGVKLYIKKQKSSIFSINCLAYTVPDYAFLTVNISR